MRRTYYFFLYTPDTSSRAIRSLMVVAGDGSDSLESTFRRDGTARTPGLYTLFRSHQITLETTASSVVVLGSRFARSSFFLSEAMSTGGYDNRAGGVQLRGELTQFTTIFPYWPPLSGSISRNREAHSSNYLITWTRARNVAESYAARGGAGVDVFGTVRTRTRQWRHTAALGSLPI